MIPALSPITYVHCTRPFLKISYAREIHLSLDHGEWDSEEVTKWLKFHCICNQTIDLILLHADKCKEFSDISSDPNSSADLKAAVAREKEQNPLLYVPWPVPSSWARGVHLHQHPDVPMHLLFLGIVKTVIFRVEKWLTRQVKAKPFRDMMKGILEGVQELNLSWCVVLPYKGGLFSGLVSENWLGMSRLLKWYFLSIPFASASGLGPGLFASVCLPSFSGSTIRDGVWPTQGSS